MNMMPPLPNRVSRFVKDNTHPGLALDKYAKSWCEDGASEQFSKTVQKPTLEKVVDLSQSPPDGLDYKALVTRWKNTVGIEPHQEGTTVFQCKTAGPLTLHLSRASALENSGICLHPLYGFVYLPGSGLKGMARAYAETVWLQKKENVTSPEAKRAAQNKIEKVFGCVNSQGGGEKDDGVDNCIAEAHAGNIVFHDSWPEEWPRLIVDITNNHHPKYYEGTDNEPPGDWEDPIPLYFLAIKPGNSFNFVLSKRRSDISDELINLAKEWITGSLCHLGAGAKTNAGYGSFVPVEGHAPAFPKTVRHETFECELELVSPAFLAGAKQKAEDCELRPASLRGQLRWWWRTMHAADLVVEDLRKLESVLWGNGSRGGAISLELSTEIHSFQSMEFNKNKLLKDYSVTRPSDRKTMPGFWYTSYGMDEQKRKRFYLPNGASWHLRFITRELTEYRIDAQSVMEQALASLWLLTHLGGIGSKTRNGFGSVSISKNSFMKFADLESLMEWSDNISNVIYDKFDFCIQEVVESPSIRYTIGPYYKKMNTQNIWQAIDRYGMAKQIVAKDYKHRPSKIALGLPRSIDHYTKPSLKGPKGERHSSPLFAHFCKDESGVYAVRIIAFPSPYLPSIQESENTLLDMITKLTNQLSK